MRIRIDKDERGTGTDRRIDPVEAASAGVVRRGRPDTTPCGPEDERERAHRAVGQSRTVLRRLSEQVRRGKAVEPERLTPLVAAISASIARNASALIDILRLRSADDHDLLHAASVAALMINLARTLDLDAARIAEIGMAGLLHDAGTLLLPAGLSNKRDPTDEEAALLRSHALIGGDLLRRSKGVPETAIDLCLHHHERIDGKGYPYGLAAAQLSLVARIGAICDTYDELTCRGGLSPQRALSRLFRWRGRFDGELLAAFARGIDVFPVGTLVRVRRDYLAIVAGEVPDDPLRPMIRAFYCIHAGGRFPPEDIAFAVPSALVVENPGEWGLGDWTALSYELLKPQVTAQGRSA